MPPLSPSHSLPVDALRAQVEAIQASSRREVLRAFPFGIDEMDRRLTGCGLPVGALHELTGASSSLNDDAAATLFGAGMAARLTKTGGSVLWVLTRRDLFAPALAQVGLAPDRLIYAECRNDEEALAVMEEGLRHGSLSAVVGEIGRMTMTATRRLQLAAEDHGTMAVALKRWRRGGEDPLAAPSAAATRWRIGCVPSQELGVSGIARPRWQIDLVRQRGGPPHLWIMEGVDEAGCLALPAEPQHRTAAALGDRAAA